MNLAAVYHEAKSTFAYAYDSHTIHIRLRLEKDDDIHPFLVYGDPFKWVELDDGTYVWEGSKTKKIPLDKDYSTKLHDYYFISIQLPTKRMKYAFILENETEKYLYGAHNVSDISSYQPEYKGYNFFNFFNFPYINPEDIYHAPDWVEDTIWYEIFPERFCNGDTTNDPLNTRPWNDTLDVKNNMFFGGDLQGVIDQLDYIKELGCNGIYFTPIFESPSTHKYDTTNYFKIDPQFGDKDTFKRLVTEAHKRDIKVMLDAVFNHCGFQHPYFQDVIKNGENSIYKNSFYIHDYPVINFPLDDNNLPDRTKIKWSKPAPLHYETFAFTPFMPKWNTYDQHARRHLIDVATYWIKEFDIDGWRLDVSNEVSHDFWREFKGETLKIKDIFILGENWDNSNPWLKGDQLDAVMNYELLFGIWGYFGTSENNVTNKMNSTAFKESINTVFTMYPKHVLKNMFNLLDSHDTSRILHIVDEDKDIAKLAYVFLFSLPGAPTIYYGGEVGISGGHDPLNRRCMVWDQKQQDLNMLSFIKKMIRLRKQYPQFKSTNFTWIETHNQPDYVIYQKEDILFIINNSTEPISLDCTKYTKQHKMKNLMNNEIIDISTIIIQPYSFFILK